MEECEGDGSYLGSFATSTRRCYSTASGSCLLFGHADLQVSGFARLRLLGVRVPAVHDAIGAKGSGRNVCPQLRLIQHGPLLVLLLLGGRRP